MKPVLAMLIIMGLTLTIPGTAVGAGSKAENKMPPPGQIRNVTFADSGSTLMLNVGDTLSIMLSGDPSTGYGWYIASVDSTMLGRITLPKPGQKSKKPGKVGGPSPFYFDFEIISPGQSAIRIVYKREWERDNPPARIFEINLYISGPEENQK